MQKITNQTIRCFESTGDKFEYTILSRCESFSR